MFHIIQMCSVITHGRLLNGQIYAQRFQKLVYLHLFTDYFMKFSPQLSVKLQCLFEETIFLEQSVNKCIYINL